MGILAAYIATMGVIGYRWFHQAKQPPPPVAIAAVTAIYGGISLIGKSEEAETFAGTLAWAVFLGALAAPALPIHAVQAAYGVPEQKKVPTIAGTVEQGVGQTLINTLRNLPIIAP